MPDWKKIVQGRIASLRLHGPAESDLTDEFAQHLEDRYQELRSGGASEAEAYQTTLSELDDMYPVKVELKRSQFMPSDDWREGNLIEDLWRDLRYTSRTLRKNPLFVLFVVLTLSLGIGANTTVFTLINTFILHPLPVPTSSELAAVSMTEVKSSQSRAALPISYADLKEYQAKNEVF